MIKVVICAAMMAMLPQAATEPVAIDKEPFHHFVMQNEFTRVFSVEVPVGKQTLMHEHKNDYIFVTIGDSSVENLPDGKAPVLLKLADGETRYIKAPLTHVAKDLAATPFRNVTVEILKAGVAGENSKVRETGSLGGVTQHSIVENDKVRVTQITMEPGGKIPTHTHKLPHLAVAVSDLHLLSTPYHANDLVSLQGPSAHLDVKAGGSSWIPAGVTHSLENVGAEKARLVVIEFKRDEEPKPAPVKPLRCLPASLLDNSSKVL